MIFGNPESFAIEAFHEPSSLRWLGCGRFCLHLHNVQVGSISDNHCSLFDITDRMRKLESNVGTLWDDTFRGLSGIEVFRQINRALYEDGSEVAYSYTYSKYDFLTNSAEMFDGTKTFVYSTPEGIVYVLYQSRDDVIHSVTCRIETFKMVIADYVQWFDNELRMKRTSYFPINPFDPNEKVPDDWD